MSSTEVRAATLRRDGTIAQRRFPVGGSDTGPTVASGLSDTLANAVLAMHASSRTFSEIVVACETESMRRAVEEGIRDSGYHNAHIVPTATAQWYGIVAQSAEHTEGLVGSALLVDVDGAHARVSLVDSDSGEVSLQVQGQVADDTQIARLLMGVANELALSEDVDLDVVWVSEPAGALADIARSVFAVPTVSSAEPRYIAAFGALHLAQQAGLPAVPVARRRGVSFHEGRKVYIAAAVAAVAVAIGAVLVGLVHTGRPDVPVEAFAAVAPTNAVAPTTAVELPPEPVAAPPAAPEPSPTTALTFTYVAPTPPPPPPAPTSAPTVAPVRTDSPTTTVSIETEPTPEAEPTPTAAARVVPPEPAPVLAPPSTTASEPPSSTPPSTAAPSTAAPSSAPPSTDAPSDPRPSRTPPAPPDDVDEVEVIDLIAEFLRSANAR